MVSVPRPTSTSVESLRPLGFSFVQTDLSLLSLWGLRYSGSRDCSASSWPSSRGVTHARPSVCPPRVSKSSSLCTALAIFLFCSGTPGPVGVPPRLPTGPWASPASLCSVLTPCFYTVGDSVSRCISRRCPVTCSCVLVPALSF